MTHNNNRTREFAPLPPIPGRRDLAVESPDFLSDEGEALRIADEAEAPSVAHRGDEWRWLDPLLPPEDAPVDPLPEPDSMYAEEPEQVVPAGRVRQDFTDPEPTAHRPTRDQSASITDPEPRSRTKPRGRAVMAVFFAALTLAVVGGGAWLVFSGGDEEPSIAAFDAPPASESVVESDAQPACVSKSSGNTVTGAGAGDQESGPGVISAFNHAYYVERDAVAARAVTVKNAVSPDLQRYIDGTPEGTTHCLTITRRGEGLWAVQIALTAPGQQPDLIKQLVQTTEADGRFWITSFTKDQG